MKPEIAVQIFTGGYRNQAVSFDRIEEKLSFVLPKIPVNKVIMGWAPASGETYEKTAALLKRQKIEFWLWFPVFSETGALRSLDPLIGFDGKAIVWDGIQKDEDFSFCCPNNQGNIAKILDVYEKEFSCVKFDGIFLDKIRYPSFANGPDTEDAIKSGARCVLSCFCPDCLEYYRQKNFDVNLFKNILSDSNYIFNFSRYAGGGKYQFNHDSFSEFIFLKSGIITQSMEYICRYFRRKGLKIGMDVFAPFLSPFVGQDITALSAMCDFIKPMMYRRTNAPAGLPFETEMLLRGTKAAGIHFRELPGGYLDKTPFDLSFAAKDLAAMVSPLSCPVYAGVEINRKPLIAEVYPAYIAETINAYYKTGIAGFALSWDLLDAPEENIIQAADSMGKL